MQIVIDISEEEYAAILGNADIIRKRKKNTLEEAVLSGTPLPKGATNGDMIKAMFSEVEVTYNGFLVKVELEAFGFTVEERWWNAPYKYRKVRNKE